MRRFRPETLELLRAPSADAAAARLLELRIPPLGEQDPSSHEVHAAAYTAAAPEQGVRGFRASLQVSTLLFLMVAAGVLLALVLAWEALGQADRPLLAPERFEMVTAVEILLLAPTALVPVHLAFHASVHWRARTHGRAVLRVALGDDAARHRGLPCRSPFHGIWASWAFLARCLATLLYGYAGLDVLAWWGGRESGGPTIAPVVIAYAVPVALILLVVRSRARLWQRRDDVLDTQLYRGEGESPAARPVVEDPDGESDDPAFPAAPQRSACHSEYSARFGAADHLVDPERGER